MTVNGKIKKLFAYKQSSGWCSGIITSDEGKDVKFSGIIKDAREGFLIEAEGEIVNDEKYGPQLKVMSAKLGTPVSKEGIITALTGYDGIGPALAGKIFDTFGDKSLKIVKKDPDKLISVPGITEKKIAKIKNSSGNDDLVDKILVATNSAVTRHMAENIAKVWGNNAIKKLNETPYDLIRDFKNIGFKTADKIAKGLSISPYDPMRIRAALVYILHEEHNKNGHMFLTAHYLQSEVLKLMCDLGGIKLATTRKQNALERYMTEEIENYFKNRDEINEKLGLTDSELEFIDNWLDIAKEIINDLASVILDAVADNEIFVDKEDNIYYKFDYESELFVSNAIGVLSFLEPIKKIKEEDIQAKIEAEEKKSGYKLGDEQKEAISTSVKNRVSVITGGPGRGKTTIINTILKIWNDDENVILCAPTGRAAQRMKEQTHHDSSTIHSLIHKGEIMNFTNKLFIVDECSMLDINLAASLLWLILNGNNNVIFVGDADQLPSVGAGNFFNDLILSNIVNVTILKTGYRNFGNIANNAMKINFGAPFSKMCMGSDFSFTECDHEELQKKLIDRYEELLKKYNQKDICILSPMKTRSTSSTEVFNDLIRKKFNANVVNPEYKNCKFVLEDRVMCIKNHKDKELTKDGIPTNGVFNGDCGTVTNIDLENNTYTITFDDDKIGEFESSELNDFILAYAITIHKSQGSEYKSVILALTTEHFVMLQRNLLYTAVTRAKESVDVFGMKKAFNMAVRNTDYKLRNSRFKKSLIECVMGMDKNDPEGVKNFKAEIMERFANVNLKKKSMSYYSDED